MPPLLFLVCLAGCATHADRLRAIREDFYAGNLEAAAQSIDEGLDRGGGDADVLKLEGAMVHLAAGRPRQAEQLLRRVRDRFDALEQVDVGEETLAMISDDNRRAYAGEDYEKVLIRAMLALANLMGDGGDATAYALQITDKQQQIVRAGVDSEGNNPKLAYKRVALGAYLFGMLREETHSNYDDVARSYAKVVSWEPEFSPGKRDLERAVHGRHSAPGNGVLYVFALVGRGPYKEEVSEAPSSAALLIADRILSATGDHTLPPTVAPVKVPLVVVPRNRIESVRVFADGGLAGKTETITDVGRLAVEQYRAIYPRVLARAVVRRIVKKGVVYGAKEALDVENDSWLNLLFDLGGIAWEATEAADTRCWGLLPAKIQVLRLELPAGEHRITLGPIGGGRPCGPEASQRVRIADGRNTYLLANFPDSGLVGTVLTNSR